MRLSYETMLLLVSMGDKGASFLLDMYGHLAAPSSRNDVRFYYGTTTVDRSEGVLFVK